MVGMVVVLRQATGYSEHYYNIVGVNCGLLVQYLVVECTHCSPVNTSVFTVGGHPQSSYPTQSGSNPAVYHGKFDAGARFSGGATANVPVSL